jgi:integrase
VSDEPHTLAVVAAPQEADEATTAIVLPVDAPPPNPVDVYEAGLGSANSQRALQDSLRRILRLLGKNEERWREVPWHRMSPAKAVEIQRLLVDNHGVSTARVGMSMLRGVFKVAWRLEYIDGERLARLRDTPVINGNAEPVGRQLSTDELRRCLASAQKGNAFVGARNAALFVLALAGLRRFELSKAKVDDVRDDARSLHVLGKRKKHRNVPLSPWTGSVVEAWLAQRARFEFSCDWLFVDVRNGRAQNDPLSVWQVWHTLTRIGEDAGVEFSTHDLRRTLVSDLLDSYDYGTVGGIVGHADPRTTARYDKRPETKKAEAMASLDKRWDLSK